MGDLIEIFVDNIAPILIVAALGFVLGRRFTVDSRTLSRVLFYIFSPALIFDSLSKNRVSGAELAQIAVVILLFVAIMSAIAYFVARWRTPSKPDRAIMILAAICPNNGNMGLPLIGFAFDADVLARAVVVYVALTLLNYTAGVFVASSGHRTPREALATLARVPVVYAALAGLLVSAGGVSLPPVLARSATLMAQASIPCMLVLLGLQLARATRLSHMRLVGVGTGLRLLVAPLVAFALVAALGIHGPTSTAVIMQASMPMAVVTLIFAAEYGLDDRLISSTILISTLLSPVTLSILIFILRRAAAPA